MWFSRISLVAMLMALAQLSTETSGLKINKNTIELLNNGFKALVSIRQILNTIRSVNELSAQAFPAFSSQANKPRIGFMKKLFGKTLLSQQKSATTKVLQTKRNPSVGLIKIGEKPPPGLFPETLPYSVSQLEMNSNSGSFKLPDQQINSLETHINRYFESNQSAAPPIDI